jgi:hypothetical protein
MNFAHPRTTRKESKVKSTQKFKAPNQLRRAAIQSGLVLLLVSIGNMCAAAEQHPFAARVKILVSNYSSASRSTLTKAERVAARILSKAGFQADWVECGVPLTAEADPACAANITTWDIRLRILNSPQGNTLGEGVLGFAVAPARANVFYDYAMRIANEDGAPYETPEILGSVIVHEIGHLLLDPQAHSATGIMQPEWRREQLDQIMKSRLVFTPAQAKIIREEVAIRLRLQTAALVKSLASN